MYGLREAPRLCYLKASRILKEAGWEELEAARSCYVLRDKHDNNKVVGMLLLHVDDAYFGGSGQLYDKVIQNTLHKFTVGKTQEQEFDVLGRHVTQRPDFTIEVDMDRYLRQVQKVIIPMARRKQPTSALTPKEIHDYRSILGH